MKGVGLGVNLVKKWTKNNDQSSHTLNCVKLADIIDYQEQIDLHITCLKKQKHTTL